jgi:hypothetical protein
MIATAVIEEIRELLRTRRMSQRAIAERLGVSRGTVNAIACGKRSASAVRNRRENKGFQPPDGVFRRCPGCGGLVQMPCLLCYVRAKTCVASR